MRDAATPWAGTAANAAVVRNRMASDACAATDGIVYQTRNTYVRSQAGALMPSDALQRVVDRNRAQASTFALADGFAYTVQEPALITTGISMHIIPLGSGNIDSRYPRAYGDMLYIADGAAMSDGAVSTVWSASGLDKNLHIGHDPDGDIDSTYVYAPPVNQAPYFDELPVSLGFWYGIGGSYDFGTRTHDPDGDTLTFSLQGTAYSGIYINPTTGILTVATTAAVGVRTLTIHATDPFGLYDSHICTVTIQQSAGTGVLMHDNTFDIDPWNPPSDWSRSKTGGGGEYYLLQTTTPRSGARSMRFRLVRNPILRNSWRVEFSSSIDERFPFCTSATAPTPIEQWIGYSMRLSSDWINDTDWDVLGQWHAGNTIEGVWAGGIANWDASPILAMYAAQDNMRLVIRWQDEIPAVRSPLYNQISANVIPINSIKGVWVDYVWNVNWDWRTYAAGGTGRVHLWWRRPGESWTTAANHIYSGPVGTNDYQVSPLLRGAIYYYKFGIYKRGWGETWGDSSISSERIVEYDNMKIIRSGGSFAQVVPPGAPF